MILGYGQPVELPTMSVFDKPMMQMYIQALQKDYEQGVAEQKEFLSNFGNFTSPSSTDVDYWNSQTIDPLREYLDQNPDALRSVEGRNALSRFIATRPYGELAKRRQSAENMKQYKQALATGIANGTLDAATALKLDGDFQNWDSAKGMWDKLAPTAQRTINQVLAPYIEDLNKYGYEYDQEASNKRGRGWIVKRVSDQAIKDELNKHAMDIMRDPMMKLRAEELGLTPDEFVEQELYTHVRRELTDKEDKDDVYFANENLNINREELGLKKRELALKEREARGDIELKKANAKKALAAAGGSKPGDEGYSYNYNSFSGAMAARGYTGTYVQNPDGSVSYLDPVEHENAAKDYYVFNMLKNAPVYIKNKKTGKYEKVKFGSLSAKQQDELLKRPDSKIHQLKLSYEKKFYQNDQARLIDDYIKRGGNYKTASLAMSSQDDAEQWKADVAGSPIAYDGNYKPKGFSINSTLRGSLYTVGELTMRTGQMSVGGKRIGKRSFAENNDTRNKAAYYTVSNDGARNGQIYQWEAYDGQYHRYRLVNVYDDTDTPLGEMWLECPNPADINSTRSQGQDNRAIKNAGNGVKAIQSALATSSDDTETTTN